MMSPKGHVIYLATLGARPLKTWWLAEWRVFPHNDRPMNTTRDSKLGEIETDCGTKKKT